MEKRNTVLKSGKHVVSVGGDGRLLTVGQTAEFLQCSASALNKWRVSGSGPPYVPHRRARALDRVSDLTAFLESKTRVSDIGGVGRLAAPIRRIAALASQRSP